MPWVNHFPQDNTNDFLKIYPLDNDISSGYPYPMFEQLGSGSLFLLIWACKQTASWKAACFSPQGPVVQKHFSDFFSIVFRPSNRQTVEIKNKLILLFKLWYLNSKFHTNPGISKPTFEQPAQTLRILVTAGTRGKCKWENRRFVDISYVMSLD